MSVPPREVAPTGGALTWACLAEGLVLGAGAGAMSLGGDALVNAPRAFVLALVFGGALGALVGGLLGAVRRLSAALPGRLVVVFCLLGGVGLGLLSAVSIGALDNLRGSKRALAFITLAGAGVGGGALGGALVVAHVRALREWLGSRSKLVCRVVGAASILAALSVVAAPQLARWLLVYPLAMQVSVGAAFLLTYAGLSCCLELRFVSRPRRALALPGAAVLGLVALALAPRSAFVALAGAPQGVRVLMALRAATDQDGDGSSAWYGGGDCAPRDPRVHPAAREVPGNGVDDNCLLGDAKPRAVSSALPVAAPSAPARVSVVLITIDALRADHTTPYGYARPTTPELERFAQGARRYTRAVTAGARTGLGLVTLLGGVQAREQRWHLVPRVVPGRGPNQSPWDVVPREWSVQPIPRVLSGRGMRTGAVLHFGAASWFSAGRTFEPLFDRFEVAPDREAASDERTVDVALEVAKNFAEQPYFLWVHLYGPHEPHLPPTADTPSFGPGISGKYDADVWQSDRELGRLLRELPAQPGLERFVVVTADHSEEFAGDRTFHAVDMFGETPQIPLLVRGPGVEPGVDERLVSAVDLAPSIMAWTGTPSPYAGHALSAPSRRQVAICDAFRPARSGGFSLEHVVVTDGRSRLTFDPWTGREAVSSFIVGEATEEGAAEPLRRALFDYIERDGPPDITVAKP